LGAIELANHARRHPAVGGVWQSDAGPGASARPQQRLVKTGERLVKHARHYWLLLAESHLTQRLFGEMLQRIRALPVPTG
jgi:hypothetical protein